MAGLRDPKDLTYFVLWSEADGCYVGRCGEFPSLRSVGETGAEALHEIVRSVGEAIASMATATGSGEAPAEWPGATGPSAWR